MLTEQEIRKTLAAHSRYNEKGLIEFCDECSSPWPCDAHKALTDLQAMRESLRDMTPADSYDLGELLPTCNFCGWTKTLEQHSPQCQWVKAHNLIEGSD